GVSGNSWAFWSLQLASTKTLRSTPRIAFFLSPVFICFPPCLAAAALSQVSFRKQSSTLQGLLFSIARAVGYVNILHLLPLLFCFYLFKLLMPIFFPRKCSKQFPLFA